MRAEAVTDFLESVLHFHDVHPRVCGLLLDAVGFRHLLLASDDAPSFTRLRITSTRDLAVAGVVAVAVSIGSAVVFAIALSVAAAAAASCPSAEALLLHHFPLVSRGF